MKEEVYKAIRSIPIDSIPGPNGFDYGFYITCWEFVKINLMEAVKKFFNGMPIPKFFNFSYIVLVPKIMKPISFENLGPLAYVRLLIKYSLRLL